MARKVRPKKRMFFHQSATGDHYAKVTVEWSEHDDAPTSWKAAAQAVAESAFMAADKARDIVDAMVGKSVKPQEDCRRAAVFKALYPMIGESGLSVTAYCAAAHRCFVKTGIVMRCPDARNDWPCTTPLECRYRCHRRERRVGLVAGGIFFGAAGVLMLAVAHWF